MEEDNNLSTISSESPNKLIPEIIRCINISKEFEIGDFIVRALDSVTFNVIRGELIVIQGPSGAGKSTLLSLISGLDTPSKGEIFIEWVKISSLSEESMSIFRVGTIGYIFQNYNLISSLTAEENILFPMQLAQMEITLQEQRVNLLLKKIGLHERAEHLPFQLSAGEQQRVGIARALANNPAIILADEPTANLDKNSSVLISELFAEMNKEGKTILVATHDENLIKLAHRVFTVEDGKITNEKKQKDPPLLDDISIPDTYKPCPICSMYHPPGTISCGFCGALLSNKE